MTHAEKFQAPEIDPYTRFFYWSYFVFRHCLGPKHGPYGPDRFLKIQRALEKRILDQSAGSGPAPVFEVPQLDEGRWSRSNFQQQYLRLNSPVVLKGMAKGWPASKQWTLDWFKENAGEEEVPVRVFGDAVSSDGLYFKNVTLRELIGNIREGGTYYGSNLIDLLSRRPELPASLDLNELRDFLCLKPNGKIILTQLFISGRGARTPFHCESGVFLYAVLSGRKKWCLVDPAHSLWMYPVTRKNMVYVLTHLDPSKSAEHLAEQGYPLYNYVPKFTATLEKGDVLFVPQWWWHAVDTETESIGVSVKASNRLIWGNRLYSLLCLFSNESPAVVYKRLRRNWSNGQRSDPERLFEKMV